MHMLNNLQNLGKFLWMNIKQVIDDSYSLTSQIQIKKVKWVCTYDGAFCSNSILFKAHKIGINAFFFYFNKCTVNYQIKRN